MRQNNDEVDLKHQEYGIRYPEAQMGKNMGFRGFMNILYPQNLTDTTDAASS